MIVLVVIQQLNLNIKKEEILSLPNMYFGDSVDDINCNNQLKILMGFCINSGVTAPRKTTSHYNSWNHAKIKIANDLYKIKHWKIFFYLKKIIEIIN